MLKTSLPCAFEVNNASCLAGDALRNAAAFLSFVSVKIAWLSEMYSEHILLGSTEELEPHSLVCATATAPGMVIVLWHLLNPAWELFGRLQANTG